MTLGIIGAVVDSDHDRSWKCRRERFQPLQPARRYWGSAPVFVMLVILHAVRGLLHLLRPSPRVRVSVFGTSDVEAQLSP